MSDRKVAVKDAEVAAMMSKLGHLATTLESSRPQRFRWTADSSKERGFMWGGAPGGRIGRDLSMR